jgi:cysteinyl-tRNA synthetase
MHNGFLQVEGEKMSKSLGNFITIRELLNQRPDNRWWGEILRLNMLRTHYRQPIDWTERNLIETEVIYENLRHAVINASRASARISAKVLEALSDDLNSHAVITQLIALARLARSSDSQDSPADAADELVGSLVFLGFDRAVEHVKEERGVREDVLRAIAEVEAKNAGIDVAKANALVDARNAARKAKDFKEADRIRDELAGMGIVLKDSKDGTIWEVAR